MRQPVPSDELQRSIRIRTRPVPSTDRLNLDSALLIPCASLLTVSRTINFLFKVLFIFPSRYLFAIGLSPVFSLRWNLPPASGCTPKQPDSTRAHRTVPLRRMTGFSPSPIPRSKGFWRRGGPMAPLQTTIQEATVWPPDFRRELCPLHSPLLGASLLVSFPPLSDMLKFSG